MKNLREQWRLIILGAIVWLLCGLFMLRLADLQIVNGASYLAAQQMGSSITQTIKAARGDIFDRNGSPLAYNEVHYNTESCARLPRREVKTRPFSSSQNPAKKRRAMAGIPSGHIVGPQCFMGWEEEIAHIKSKAS
jgi:cell division protein FtsI/penicillin-binding protein 2